MARSFPGSTNTDVINFGAIPGYTLRTVSFWFYLDSIDSTARRFFEWEDAGGRIDRLYINTTDSFNFSVGWTGAGTFIIKAATFTPSTDAWHHCCITYDGSLTSNVAVIYIDNTTYSQTNTAPTGTIRSSSTTHYVGNLAAGNRCLNGKVAEFARWNSILTVSEITALSKGTSPLLVKKPVLYAPLIGRNSPERDLIGGLSGTLTGTSNYPHPRIIYPYGDPTGVAKHDR